MRTVFVLSLLACLFTSACSESVEETSSGEQADTVAASAADAADLEARRKKIEEIYAFSRFKFSERIDFGADGTTKPWRHGYVACQLRLSSGPSPEPRALLPGEYDIARIEAVARGAAEEELRFNLTNAKTQGLPGYEAKRGTPADFDVRCVARKTKINVDTVSEALRPVLHHEVI